MSKDLSVALFMLLCFALLPRTRAQDINQKDLEGLKQIYEPLMHHIYSDLQEQLTKRERRNLDNAPLTITTDWNSRAFVAVPEPADCRGIVVTVGSISEVHDILMAQLMPVTLFDDETPSWFHLYCAYLRQGYLRYARTHENDRAMTAIEAAGFDVDDIPPAVVGYVGAAFEDALYFIMAHEIGHLAHKHEIKTV